MATRSEAKASAKRVLLSGASGFTGRYVAAELESNGYEVIGLTHVGGETAKNMHAVDLCDQSALSAVLAGSAFDAVVHLAAISFVAHGDADEIYRVNIVGTRNLLKALAEAEVSPRVVVLASSANIYGNAAVEPITEDTNPAPANDYAVSKLAMEYMASLWQEQLPITLVRPFNYTGIGQGARFLLPKIVGHFRTREKQIELGNLRVWRDFMDVRDVARAYAGIVDAAPVGRTFNICSGVAHSLEEVLAMMQQIAGYAIDVRVNPEFVRANEVTRLVGSAARLEEAIGEFRSYSLEDTLRWMYRAN